MSPPVIIWCLYSQMTTTISLMNTHCHIQLQVFFLAMRTFKLSLCNFQICSAVLLTIVMLYITPLDLFYSDLCTFWPPSPISPTFPHPTSCQLLICSLCRSLIFVLDSICKWHPRVFVSLPDLFNLAQCPQGPSVLSVMARFHSFSVWIILHCLYIPHFLYPFILWWTLGLFPYLGYWK